MMSLIVSIAIFVIFAILIWWLLTQLPLPAPLLQILTIVAVVIGALFLVGILYQFAGGGVAHFPNLR